MLKPELRNPSIRIITILLLLVIAGFGYRSELISDPFDHNAIQQPLRNDLPGISNFRIFPSSLLQVETSAFTKPTNSNFIAATAITNFYAGGYTTGFYLSTNNGLNWTGTDHIVDALGNTVVTVGDPTLLISPAGNIIIPYIALPPSGGSDLKVGVRYSVNNGTHWSPLVYIPKVDTADKPISAIDNSSTSPYHGRSYIAYGELTFNQQQVKGLNLSYSTNGGVSWDTSRRITISNPDYRHRITADITTNTAGNLYVSWYTNRSYIGLAKSTNGGVSWAINNDTALSTTLGKYSLVNNGEVYLQSLPGMKTDNTGGAYDGSLYIVNLQSGSDSIDLMLHRSTNDGSSWRNTIVNQDNTGLVKFQVMPAMNVDKYGGINVFYYDARNSSANDSFEVYLSRSVDGGITFEDTKISDHKIRFSQPPVFLFDVEGYIGSYIGVSEGNEKLIPVWYDNSSGTYQAWTANLSLLPEYEVTVIPEGFYDASTGKLRMKDTAKVYLRSSLPPYAIVDSAKGTIDSVSFKLNLKFHSNLQSGNYYLEIQHRNTIETWTASPVNYTFGSKVIYDFTGTDSSAFGNNLKLTGGGWAMFSGDVNKDGIVDVKDLINIYNAGVNFLSGYYPEDCNGDSFVDVSDIVIAYNNSVNFVSMIRP